MSLKSRLKHLELNMKPKGKDSVQEWRDRVKRNEEIDCLDPYIEEGDATYKYLYEKVKVSNTKVPLLKKWISRSV